MKRMFVKESVKLIVNIILVIGLTIMIIESIGGF